MLLTSIPNGILLDVSVRLAITLSLLFTTTPKSKTFPFLKSLRTSFTFSIADSFSFSVTFFTTVLIEILAKSTLFNFSIVLLLMIFLISSFKAFSCLFDKLVEPSLLETVL